MTLSRTLRAAIAALIVLVAQACGVDEDGRNLVGPDEMDGPDPLVETLIQMGFQADMIEEFPDHFVVEGDMVLTKDMLRQEAVSPRALIPAQRRHFSLVSAPFNVTVRLDNLQSNWADAARNAMSSWNQITGARVMFFETTSSSADVRVYMWDAPLWETDIARAELPNSYGQPGSYVKINSNYNSYSLSFKHLALAHELGHTIGFQHTGSTKGIHIGDTPTSESTSVMNSSIAPSWSGFSPGDIEATRVLYSDLADVSVSYPSGFAYLTWSSVHAAPAYNIYHVEEDCYYTGYYNLVCEDEWDFIGSTTSTSFSTGIPWTGSTACHSRFFVLADWVGGEAFDGGKVVAEVGEASGTPSCYPTG